MHKFCGKIVNRLGKSEGKNSGFSSTTMLAEGLMRATAMVKPPSLHIFFPHFTLAYSTAKITHLPLIEHYFYPASTAPITTITKEKIKER